MNNPFTVRGMIQNPADFIGRKEELRHIFSRIETVQSCSIVGERRIGKSSLLYHLYQTGNEKLNNQLLRFVYLELTDACAQNLAGLLTAILKTLSLPVDTIKSDQIASQNLVEFNDAIVGLTSSQGVIVVLLLDMFETLFDHPKEFNAVFFNHLRTMMNQRKIIIITTSEKDLAFYAAQEKIVSPFFNLITTIQLKDFSETEKQQFIDYYHPIVQFEQRELEFIKEYGDKKPLNLQICCEKLIDWRSRGWVKDLIMEDIRNACQGSTNQRYKGTKFFTKVKNFGGLGKMILSKIIDKTMGE